MLEQKTATRLDEIAREAGTTHFIIRLAAFAALLAGVTGNSTVTLHTRSTIAIVLNRRPSLVHS